jgi:hypothetical protein
MGDESQVRAKHGPADLLIRRPACSRETWLPAATHQDYQDTSRDSRGSRPSSTREGTP